MTPEQRLWMAVLAQAAMDAGAPTFYQMTPERRQKETDERIASVVSRSRRAFNHVVKASDELAKIEADPIPPDDKLFPAYQYMLGRALITLRQQAEFAANAIAAQTARLNSVPENAIPGSQLGAVREARRFWTSDSPQCVTARKIIAEFAGFDGDPKLRAKPPAYSASDAEWSAWLNRSGIPIVMRD